jgi:hypothetical protein
MRPRSWARPSFPLPPTHPHQFRALVDLHNAVDLPVRMQMVLARVLLMGVHVDGRDAEVVRLGRGETHFATTVFGTVELVGGDPAFVLGDGLAD